MSSKSTMDQPARATEAFVYPSASSSSAGAGETASATSLWTPRKEVKLEPDAGVLVREQQQQQAWNKGLEAGRAESRAAFEQQAAQLRDEIFKAVREFAAERDSYFQRVEEQVVRLTLAIARKILHREAQVDPLLLAGVLRVALEKIGANTGTRLRANPADIKAWRDHFAQPREGFTPPDLLGDAEVQPGRCILETELGTTEIGLETQLKEIEQGFLDLLTQRPGSTGSS